MAKGLVFNGAFIEELGALGKAMVRKASEPSN